MSQVTIFALQRSKTEFEKFEWRFNSGTDEIGVDDKEMTAALGLWLVRRKCLDPIYLWQRQTLHLHYCP